MKCLLIVALVLVGTSAFAQELSLQFCLKSNHPHSNGVLLDNINYRNTTKTPFSIVCQHQKDRNYMTTGNEGSGFKALIERDSDCLSIITAIRNNRGIVFDFLIDDSSNRVRKVQKSKTEKCDKNFEIFSKNESLVLDI